MAYDRKQAGHEVAQARRPDYRVLVGRAEVAVGASRSFAVLDEARADTLKAWVASLIPPQGSRPDAATVGAAEYVDATVQKVPELRAALIEALDGLERQAAAKAGCPFTECNLEDRENLLRQFEVEDSTDAFNMVRDFTYEAYYGHPQVLAALEADTGWRGAAPTTGSAMSPFDASTLGRVRTLPPRWRQP